jgi:hypothetical protein
MDCGFQYLLAAQSFDTPGSSKNDEYVLIENFGNVLDWFGPLSRANDMVSRVC